MLIDEPKMIIMFRASSLLFFNTHGILISIHGVTPNRISVKYRCPLKREVPELGTSTLLIR